MTTSLQPGTRLAGRYDIEFELGRGGMGVVYACTDILTTELVALKLLHTAGGAPQPGHAAWFWAEARALASLDHFCIVRGRDFGVLVTKAPYLVMDLANGLSLTSLLSETDVLWPAIWLVVDQVLSALAHAHARGVVHGDLKHSNVMVHIKGGVLTARVLDFGLAWLLRDRFDHRIDGTAPEGPMVRPHAGTVGWMAPEQIRGAVPHVGPPTDLYALGCILYQLLTGHEPYEAADLDEVQRMHRNAPVPEVMLPDDVPEGVAPFVKRLLAKRPWQRFDCAADARAVFTSFRPHGHPSTWKLLEDPVDTDVTGGHRRVSTNLLGPPRREVPSAEHVSAGMLGFGPSRFVGRLTERNSLRKCLDAITLAGPDTHHVVLLTGPAGVGKSRLAEWLCEEAHEHGLAVPLRARHHKIPSPIDGIIGAVLHHLGLENADRPIIERVLLNIWEIGRDDDEGQTWVAAVAEWLRPSIPGQMSDVGPTGKRVVINTDEIRWMVMRYTLQRLGRSRPLMIWLDDLHLASQRDLVWLRRACEEPTGFRMLAIGTMVTDAPDHHSPSFVRILDIVRRYDPRVLDVPPLSESETNELLLSSALLDGQALDVAYRRSRGIPLFALQLVHAWANGGALELRNGRYGVKSPALETLPSTTAALWDERLAWLPENIRYGAMAAAALGGDIRIDVLVPLLHALQLVPSEVLTTLEQAQILVKPDPSRYRWPHMLLQEHLLLKLSERVDAPRVFREAALALGSYHPAAGNRRIVRHRVTNLIRAKEIGEAVQLMLSFVAKGWARTRDVGATLEDLAMIDGLTRGAWAAEHKRWRAEALRHAGNFDEAMALVVAARRAFAAVNDVVNEAHCMRLMGHIASEKGSPREGRKLVQQARMLMVSQKQEWGRAQCDVVLGELDYLLGEYDRSERALRDALPPLERAQDVLGGGQCLILLALIEITRNENEKARNFLLEARQGFDRIGYRLGTAQCDVALSHADHRIGELEACRARAQNTLSAFRMLGTPRGQAGALRVMAMAALDAGDFSDAERSAMDAMAIFDKMGDPWGVVEARLILAQIALARGLPDASELVDQCDIINRVQEKEPLQHWHLTKAWLAHREARYDDAVVHLEAARDALGDGRLGDHALQLFARMSAMPWPDALRNRVRHAVLPKVVNA